MPPLINRDNTCCFTGHRPSKLPWKFQEDAQQCVALKQTIYDILDALYCSGIRHFICGMAMGCDMYFAEAVLQLRQAHSNVTLEAATPCQTQADGWPESQRQRYAVLLHQCDYTTLLQKDYTKDCMLRRNRYMIDHASVLIAVYDGTTGGTMQTIHYAKKRQLEIIQLDPGFLPEKQSVATRGLP